jgi:hypothetical protein
MPWDQLAGVCGTSALVFGAGAITFSLLRKSFAEVI